MHDFAENVKGAESKSRVAAPGWAGAVMHSSSLIQILM